MITRIAPTPSGYLHRGNAANFLLVAWLAAQGDGRVLLRIDDMDAPRYRRGYVEDVFAILLWLGIDWQLGPRSVEDFEAHFSMRARTDYYWSELQAASDRGLITYACACSRAHLDGVPTGGCPAGCRHAGLPLEEGRTALRVHVPVGTTVPVGDSLIDVSVALGDFVVWRRDGQPAYHLVSVIEDRDHAVTHIVRGEDLRESTAAQLFLAPFLAADSFSSARILHHGLLTDEDGRKLSKSQLAGGHPLDRTDAERSAIESAASRLGEPLRIRKLRRPSR